MNLPELNLEEQVMENLPVTTSGSADKKDKPTLWDKVFRKHKLKKPNITAVIFLRNNGKAETLEAESKDGFFQLNGKTYHEDSSCIFRMKDGVPLAIIPEWSLVPYGTKEWHDKPMLEKFAELQDHTLKGIRHAEIVKAGGGEKMRMSGKAIIGLIILGVVGLVVAQAYL